MRLLERYEKIKKEYRRAQGGVNMTEKRIPRSEWKS